MTQHSSLPHDLNQQRPKRGLGWLALGGSLLLASVSIHLQLARPNERAMAAVAPGPEGITALTAVLQAQPQLFAVDQGGRLWACSVSRVWSKSSQTWNDLCIWRPVLQHKAK